MGKAKRIKTLKKIAKKTAESLKGLTEPSTYVKLVKVSKGEDKNGKKLPDQIMKQVHHFRKPINWNRKILRAYANGGIKKTHETILFLRDQWIKQQAESNKKMSQ